MQEQTASPASCPICVTRGRTAARRALILLRRAMSSMFEAVGTDAIVTLEAHNPAAFENAFRCRTIALTAVPIFVEHLKPLTLGDLCVVSPDTGGAKRAELFREALQDALQCSITSAFAEKHRSAGVVSGDLFVGDVKGRTALIIDDLI